MPKKPKAIFSLFMAVFFCVLSVSACSPGKVSGVVYLGSFLSADAILYLYEPISNERAKAIKTDCKNELSEAEKTFSTEIAKSDVAKFNALKSGESVEVSKETYELIEEAKRLNAASDGAFDPTVFRLVDLWGFSARFDERYVKTEPYDRERVAGGALPLPDEKYVDAFKDLADLSSVEAESEGEKYYLKKNALSVTVDGEAYDQQIDLSALAKGYLCDRLKKILFENGVKEYYLSLGSSSIYLGERNGGKWDLELVDPSSESRASFSKIPLSNVFVSTSGTYEKAYTFEGKKYHHIIDGRTGAPFETDLLSVAVIGGNGLFSDALSTALVALGSEKALEKIGVTEGYDFVLVTESGKVYSTLPLTLINNNYELIVI